MQIMTVMRMTANGTVFQNRFQFFIGHASFFHLRYVCLPKLSSVLCRILKANLHVGKIENIQLWHFVSFVAQKRNPPNQ